MAENALQTKIENGICYLTLSRPNQLNALNHALLNELSAAFDSAGKNSAVKAILLSGEGKAFCAGADINQLADLNGVDGLMFARFGQAVFRKLELLGKPSLAAIHGYAFGGGLELAMATTIRIAQTGTVFGQPEIKLGVIPGYGGTQRLARLVGKGRALDLCLTGKRFTAENALHWGLITEVTPANEVVQRAEAILRELIELPAVALAGIMSAIDNGYELPLASALEMEAQQFALCCTTADKQEGVSAFLAKRKAQFTGK